MKFDIHNSSWLDAPDPAEAFEAVKAKAQWAENHGFVWCSVMDHMIQIPRVGTPDEAVLEGWTVLAGLAAVTDRIRLATLCTAVGYRNPAHLAKIAASVDLISRGRLGPHLQDQLDCFLHLPDAGRRKRRELPAVLLVFILEKAGADAERQPSAGPAIDL
jgi:hypothetical protein